MARACTAATCASEASRTTTIGRNAGTFRWSSTAARSVAGLAPVTRPSSSSDRSSSVTCSRIIEMLNV